MQRHPFGRLGDGTAIERLVLGSAPGPVLHLLTLGASVHRLEVTGGDGTRRNVVLGHADPAAYLASSDFIGGTIGRYANRIRAGRFPLDGRTVEVATHDRGNSLHGGPDGFDRRVWSVAEHGEAYAVLGLESPDGDQGFPGALSVQARFEVAGETVSLVLTAVSDAPTVVNLTSHTYLNLDGDGSGTIDDHELQVLADGFTPVDETGIPYGEHAEVAGTGFDAREPTRIGTMARSGDEQIATARGIDHNYVVRGTGFRPVATLASARTRTRLEVCSDQPGLQVYTGNFLDGARRDAHGGLYRQGDGIALEPQLHPDTPNHSGEGGDGGDDGWPSARLDPGATYRARTSWTFTTL